MAVFKRILQLVRADIHGVLDQLENREQLLGRNFRRMEDALRHAQRRLVRLSTARDTTELRIEQVRRKISLQEADLNRAVSKNNDDIARRLLRTLHGLRNCLSELVQRERLLVEEHKALSATCTEQQLRYESLKARAYREHLRRRTVGETAVFQQDTDVSSLLEHEVELELLRRKAALTAQEDTI